MQHESSERFAVSTEGMAELHRERPLRFTTQAEGERAVTVEQNTQAVQRTAPRYRVNVSRTSTGKWSWDCTVESQHHDQAWVLAESDKLVKELSVRYGGSHE